MALLLPPSSISQVLPAEVSIFYPTKGQSPFGGCWIGLRIDSDDNVYPISGDGVYKILPDGTLVNGVDDQNLFVSGGASGWGELDENRGKFYATDFTNVLSAPFLEGSTFSPFISGLSSGLAIALGQGPLVGSLFVTNLSPPVVNRVTLRPPRISEFASGPSFFGPEAIVSAPDGTLYVVNLNFDPPQLTKITPAGVLSTFAVGTVGQVNRAIAVDRTGNVYWSHATGINRYDTDGNLLGTLPAPPDKPAYNNPMGTAFDSRGNLYIVDSGDCKKIYKYTILLQDSDGDGIADEDDACPTSDRSPTVVIDGCDSGVPNQVSPNGCTITDQIADCAADTTTHGAFVSCVDALTTELRKARLITGPQKDAINNCAAQADIP
jgi:hypothetical protein